MTHHQLPDVVLLDVYDTATSWRPAVEAIAAELAMHPNQVYALSSDIAPITDLGEMTYAEYCAVMEQRLGVPYGQRVAEGFAPIEEVHKLAHDFREAGSRIVIASNVGSGALRLTFQKQALPPPTFFHAIVQSCRLGIAKPDPRFFKHIQGLTGAPAGRHLLLDDSEQNVQSARSLGMQAEVIDPNNIARSVQRVRERYLPTTV